MIRFLQISDIHWKDKLNALDTFKTIREEMIADVKRFINQEKKTFDYILICGDIAFSGGEKQYKRAAKFINELCELTKCGSSDVFVVPGNHDKNWKSSPQLLRELVNKHITEANDPDELLADWLQNDFLTAAMMFTPYKDYEKFAYPYGCSEPLMHRFNREKVTAESQYNEDEDRMYWSEELGEINGYTIRLYGLNSTLYSDEFDYDDTEKRRNGHKMLLSKLSSNGAKNEDGVVNIMMMHHPIPYFVNGDTLKTELDKYYHVQLYGHVHVAKSDNDNNRIHIFSGALQPDEMGTGKKVYRPVYNIIELDVEAGSKEDYLKMFLYERYWDDSKFEKYREPLSFTVTLPKYKWKGEDMEKTTKLPEGVSKRDVRLKLINNGRAKSIIAQMDPTFYNKELSLYYNVMRFLEKVRVENRWEELWNTMNS